MTEIKSVSIDHPLYPPSLKKIKNPPSVLYYRGKLPTEQEFCFAVVGTRRCSAYGRQVASFIVSDLCQAGLTIVSGFAPGIDTIAHQTTIEKGKRTIAVLGTGLDEKSIYPRSNLDLAQKILENNGCLISELPPGTPGSKFSFPQRNRIIAGLSRGVLIVEARKNSGSLITAYFAKKQNKKLFAIPGPIFSSCSQGVHQLIKEGAYLVENSNDIFKIMDITPLAQHLKEDDMTKEEMLILKLLNEGPLEVEKIIERTRLSAPTVLSTLTLLEISGKIQSLGENIYGIKN